MDNPFLFFPLAIVALWSAISMLLSRNAVHSALYLIVNFATIAVFYIILNAPFLAMVQITVYAGAIMVLFLFVIMLLGAEESAGVLGTRRGQMISALVLGGVIIGSLIAALTRLGSPAAALLVDSSPRNLAVILFETYVFPFEVTGVLLLVAVVGLFVLSKRLVKNRG